MAGRPKNSGVELVGMDGAALRRGNGKPRFLYRQLADALRREIDRGAFAPGDMLPSMDDLASRYAINKATVRQAINELVHHGLIYSIPAKGTFVAESGGAVEAGALDCLHIGWISSIQDRGCMGSYHAEMMQAAHQAVQRMGGRFMVFSSSGMTHEAFWEMIRQAGLDGALLVGPPNEEPLLHLLDDTLPAVILNDRFLGRRVSCIYIDNEDGGFLAVDHLLAQGHRKLGLVTGPSHMRIVRERMMGAEMACARHGITPEQIRVVEGDFTPDGGMHAMRELLVEGERPTGLFFFNDEMACGAVRFLYERTDYRVPDDFSIVGFDDISWARLSHPPLTTVHVDGAEIGRLAARLVIDRCNGTPIEKPIVDVGFRIIERRSTSPDHV